jgi:hypothetical protein
MKINPAIVVATARADTMISLSRRDLLALLGAGVVASLQTGCATDAQPALEHRVDLGSLHYLGLAEVAQLIAARKISPVELTQLMLDRIRAVDGRLHSYATVMADSGWLPRSLPNARFSPATIADRCTASRSRLRTSATRKGCGRRVA